MKKLFIILTACIFITGCGNGRKNKTTDQQEIQVAIPDMHNARNSLDYFGTYEGTLPCADCPGIKTVITLNQDGTYKMTTEYLDKGKGEKLETTGKYSWNDEGSKITLHSDPEGNHNRKYMVQENRLLQLDLEGNIITGDLADNYILKKTE